MEQTRSYYELLRIAPQATQDEIEQAYQRLVKYLSDKILAGTAPPKEEFDRLEVAFDTLRDPFKRAAYDNLSGVGGAGTPPPTMHPPTPAAPPDVPFTFAPSPEAPRRRQFSFHGSGGEYFRIWIVNLLLSILTLGIYSAWAKVRREQYFHRNLLLDGAGFDYHAKPTAILKGRFLAGLLFALVSATKNISPVLYALTLMAGMFAVPWFLMRAFRFRAYNSSYRGLRFSFHGTYGGAFKAYVAYGLLALITFGLCTPLWIRETRQYLLNNLRYGHGSFTCALRAGDILGIVMKAYLIAFVVIAISSLIGTAHAWIMAAAMFVNVVVFLSLTPYVRMALNNYVWDRTKLEECAFSSTMRFRPYFAIVARNWLFTLLTLGLYWPWAKVALVRYRAACTGVTVAGSLDEFVAVATEHGSAFGDEAADMFDLDIAF